MKRYTIRPAGFIAIAALAVACGSLNSALTDAENRLILTDVSGTTDSTSTAADTTVTSSPTPTPAAGDVCPGNPIRDNCGDDAKTYCADYIPPKPSEVPPENLGQQSFEKRHELEKKLLDCLKENLSSLTTACQTAVNNAPVRGEDGHFGPPPGERRPGPGCPRGRKAGGDPCRGRSLLKECVADAKTLCESELPDPGEPTNLTPDQRHTLVETIVTCLKGQIDSVSEGCQKALEHLPGNKGQQGQEPPPDAPPPQE